VTKPIRVFQLLEATVGGTKRHLLDLCAGLPSDEFEVVIGAPSIRSHHHGDTSFFEDVKDLGIDLRVLDLVRPVSPMADIRALAQIASILRDEQFDILHCHSSKAGVLGRLASVVCPKTKVVYSPHGFYFLNFPPSVKRTAYRLFERFASTFGDRVIALSNGEYNAAIDQKVTSRNKLRMIENGLDHFRVHTPDQARNMLGIPGSAITVGTVSRFTAQKSPYDVVSVVDRLRSDFPELCFLWFGVGELQKDIEREIGNRGLQDHFRLLGYRANVRSLLPAMDVFLLASQWEGLPYTIMETMYAGVPVVATDVVGSQDFIENGDTGFLVDHGDVDGLAESVARLLKSPVLSQKICFNAASRLETRFSLKSMIEKTAGIYRELVRGGS
tara:strand:+ start:3292 stop:4449 length:1158 start_codon:yes stop_codon:yes gene_type:complete